MGGAVDGAVDGWDESEAEWVDEEEEEEDRFGLRFVERNSVETR